MNIQMRIQSLDKAWPTCLEIDSMRFARFNIVNDNL